MIKKIKIIAKITILSCLFFSLIRANSVLAFQPDRSEKIDVLIGFHQAPGPSEKSLITGLGGEISRQFNIINVVSARISSQAAEALVRNPGVAYVELNSPVYAVSQTVPWGIDRVFGDESYPFDAWSITRGDGIAVAVLDTGIDENHVDLPELLGGVNTIDNTHWGSDGSGHGTHVAGTVAALDNDLGVVGVGPEIGLYAIKVLNDSGSGTLESVIAGIEWAVEQGIPVLNMSLGSSSHAQSLQDACNSAYNAGHLLVAAAGNSGNPPGRGDNVIYPAAYDSVIAVAASDINDRRASFSSTGSEVELIAPGANILSTIPNNKYAFKSGTSMASPHVAGAAALAWAANNELSNFEIREILQHTAEDLGLSSNHQGYGLVRADLAVRAASELEPIATGDIEGTVKDEVETAIEGAIVIVEGTNLSATTDADGYYLLENVPTGDQEVTASADNYYSETATVTVVENETASQDFTLQAIPTYTVSGTVTDTSGNVLEGAAVTIEETKQSATTENDGTYSIPEVEESTYDITASKSGYTSQTKNVTVEQNVTVDFTLEEIIEETQKMHVDSVKMWYRAAGPNRFIYTRVKIVCSENNPVPGAAVDLEMTLSDSSKVYLSGTTNGDGTITFKIRSRQTGEYTANVKNVAKDGWEYDSSANKKTTETILVK